MRPPQSERLSNSVPPEAWTYQERKAASALAWIIVVFVGAPSLAVALISAVFNAGFAWNIGADWQERVAWIAASVALSGLVIGLPIARPYLRERRPEVATWALWLWLALLVFSTLGAAAFLFAKRDQAARAMRSSRSPRRRAMRSRPLRMSATLSAACRDADCCVGPRARNAAGLVGAGTRSRPDRRGRTRSKTGSRPLERAAPPSNRVGSPA